MSNEVMREVEKELMWVVYLVRDLRASPDALNTWLREVSSDN